MAKQFIFINKPTIILKFDDVESIEFKRYDSSASSANRNFDLLITMKPSSKSGDTREYSFNLIDRAEYRPLLEYLTSKKLPVQNPVVSQMTYSA
jgi:structure-specific recognition protein 1